MKLKIMLSLFLSHTIFSYSQQINDGYATIKTDWTQPLLSGGYGGDNAIGRTPDNSFEWQHLFVIRHGNPTNNHQLQIGSSFTSNDRLFFRKIATDLSSSNPNWIELATRGTNNFIGNQSFSGNVGIGTTSPRANLDVAQYIPNGQIGTVFGRLGEGDGTGSGTFLGVQGFDTQGNDYRNVKSFSIVHNFYGETNSSINFYRGGGIIGGFMTFCTDNNNEQMRIAINGNIGIGTINPDEKLTVKGKIHTQEVRVDMAGPLVPDYVFADDYKLKSLQEIESYIKANKHLPEVPSAQEIEKNGLMLAEMNMILLKKMEEMTLHIIEQNKVINKVQEQLQKQNKEIENLKKTNK
ncbi:hypothetical protein SAMN02927916_3356 [Flavobacterium anhuiense]|uniref:Uncharacterized protein n=2 Tax=Flavobacterium anhuiense TaxID=459526 RepID=A0ABY0LY67_9FLAO|nr:hypothetical protein SAMN02927916_3356 [Flavobacterium anhuiense]